ncbi:MAG: CoA transferase [Syntrophales bacterium]|jgi:crotonobetainyl-CoA:carnitine CoA-transferase CaiB-like acyl-CoA transferase|nr:CoA transferase [Syntrophales bacterium]MDY0044293.1 CoA transferase [Syntrophales bacterium]
MTQDYFSFTEQLFDPSQSASKPEALKGIRVLDLTRVIFGPMIAKWMAMFGAEVIKVEEPEAGDDWRTGTYWGKFWKDSCPYFQALNPNKYFAAIDLKKQKGKDLLKDLVKKSDIVIENYRAGLVEAWGLGYMAMSKINPKIIYISCSGYGQWGPLRYFPSYDLISQSVTGVARMTGFSEDYTYKLPDYYGDFYPAILGVVGLLSAIHHREKTGKGQYIDIAQTESLMRAMHNWTYMNLAGEDLTQTGNFDPTMAPSGIFKSKDGQYVAIAIATNEQFSMLAEAMGSSELAQDPRFSEASQRLLTEHADAINTILEKWARSRTAEEIIGLAREKGFPASALMDDWKLTQDPWRKERGSVVEFEDDMYGKGTWAGPPVSLQKSPGRIKHLTRPIGYHNRYVFKEVLGLSEKDIRELERQHIIGYWDNRVGKRPPSYYDIAEDEMFNYKRDERT